MTPLTYMWINVVLASNLIPLFWNGPQKSTLLFRWVFEKLRDKQYKAIKIFKRE